MKTKRYRSIIAAIHREIWAIVPSKLEEIVAFVDLRRTGIAVAAEDIQAIVASRRQPQSSPARGIAVLNVLGTIMPRASGVMQSSGVMSLAAFNAAFDAAMSNDQIGTIIAYFDSPGGAVQGVPETAAKIRASRGKGKSLIAYGDGSLASGALWLASAFDQVIVAPSAESIGSVGAMRIHLDDTSALEKEGIVRTYLTSDKSPYKAELAGKLTDEAKTYQVNRLNAVYDQFAADLATNLNVSIADVEKKFGKGRTLMAKDALAAGMVHRIATFDQVLSELGVGPSSQPREAAMSQPQPAIEGKKMKPDEITSMVRLANISDSKKIDLIAELLPNAATATVASVLERIKAVAAEPPATLQASNPPGNPPPQKPPGGSGMTAHDITSTVRLASIPDSAKMDLVSELIPNAATTSLASVLDRINAVAQQHNKPSGATVITPTAAERDKFMASARDGILIRAWQDNLPTKIYDAAKDEDVDWKPQKRNYAMQDSIGVSRACLIQAGFPAMQVANLAPADVAMLVLGANPRDLGIMATVSDGSYNVTGMFSSVFFDAQNLILRRSYNDTATTFQRWAKLGEPVRDFKPVNKIILGELPDPKLIPEDGEFEESTTLDGRVSYSLVVWGERFSMTWQMLVNDRLNAFSDITGRQGRAMRRKQNKLVYNVLKDNANLPDGGALFNATAIATAGGHNNLLTGAATPTVVVLNGMKARMRSQTGLLVSENSVLNLEPKYLMCGANLEGTVMQLLRSMADPAFTNANVTNIWNGQLEPVIDAQLDAVGGGSDTAFYLACDAADCDTVEYAYLQGVEQPRLLQRQSLNSLGMKWDIYQAFATKAIDYRGLQKANGV